VDRLYQDRRQAVLLYAAENVLKCIVCGETDIEMSNADPPFCWHIACADKLIGAKNDKLFGLSDDND
jgi:hypothetical protein